MNERINSFSVGLPIEQNEKESPKYEKKIKVIELKRCHENISDKDYTSAFINVYRQINLIVSNRYFKSEINDSIIMMAITNCLDEYESQQHRLHFLLSLVHNSVVTKGKATYTLTSIQSLRNFNMMDMLYLAVDCINAVRKDDGFLAFIKDATFKKYEDMESIISEIYSSDEINFKQILLKLGIVNKDKKND